MRSMIVSLSIVLVTASACASHGAANPSTGEGPAQAPVNRNRDIITHEELMAPGLRAQSVLDAIRSLRPQFLSQRGLQSYTCKSPGDCQTDPDAGKVHASVDNGRILPIEELANMHVNSVLEVQFLNVAAAMQKFGGAAREGPVILVRTVK